VSLDLGTLAGRISIDGVDDAKKGISGVQTAMQQLARTQDPTVKVDADVVAATKSLASLQAELLDVNKTRTVAEITADAQQAMAEAQRVDDELVALSRQKTTVTIDADTTQASRDVGTFSKSGAAIGDDFEHGARRAAEGMDEASDSMRSNAIEVAASWDGSLSSTVGGVQGLVAEMTAGFGPAGIIAGVVAAGGLGLISSTFEKQKAAAEADADALAKSVQAMYDDMSESGKKYLSEGYIRKAVDEIVNDTDKWAAAQDTVRDSGASLGVVLRAMAGDQEDAAAVTAKINSQLEEKAKQLKATGDAWAKETDPKKAESLRLQNVGIQAQIDALDGEKDAINGTADAQSKASAQQKAADAARRKSADGTLEATKAEDAYKDSVGATGDAIKKNAKDIKNKSDRVRADNEQITAQIDAGKAWVKSLQDNGEKSSVVAKAQQQLYKDVVLAREGMGKSQASAEKYADKLLDIPDNVKTSAKLDLAAANKAVDKLLDRIKTANPTMAITVKANSSASVSVPVRVMPGTHVKFADGGELTGQVRGPGGPTDDKIPALLSNGEFVVRASSYAKHKSLVEAINADRVDKRTWEKNAVALAAGGLVPAARATTYWETR
jgi:hypothetical protein